MSDKPTISVAEFNRLHEIVKAGVKVAVGTLKALCEIFASHGYFHGGFKSWDEYCKKTLGHTGEWGRHLRRAVEFSAGHPKLEALTPSQLRALREGGLTPEQSEEIVDDLIASGDKKTVRRIRKNADLKLRGLYTKELTEAHSQLPTPSGINDIYCCDRLELIKKVNDVMLFFFDPDWSKNSELKATLVAMKRKLAKNGTVALMAGHGNYDEARKVAKSVFPVVREMVYFTRGKAGEVKGVNIWSRYKPVLICSRTNERWFTNDVESPEPDHVLHPWALHPDAVAKIIERFTRPGDLTVDPYCGAGSTALGCLRAKDGPRRFVLGDNGLVCGLVEDYPDKEKTWADIARGRVEFEQNKTPLKLAA